jgi:peptide/nickel transport system substrate-binding protein
MPARRHVRPAAAVALLLLLAACAGEPVGDLEGGGEEVEVTGDEVTGDEAGDDTGGAAGGELVLALAEDPDALDPSFARTYVGRMVFANMCEKLYDVNADLEVVPQLAAELPEFSDEATTVTIPIREGITFNDGTPLDAEAVKTSLDRHREIEGSGRASELAPVTAVEVVDPMTIEITLAEPFAPLTATLADRAGIVMSPTKLEELGENFSEDPVCVGPFQFVERVSGNRIVLEKADEYYDADAVNLDRITFSIITEGPVRVANLRSGDVDMAERLPTTNLAEIESDPNLQLFESTSIGYQGITVNVGNVAGVDQPFELRDSPLADPLVREAFELSLDRNVINEVVYNGRYVPGCSPISPVSPFAQEDLSCPERDVERAAQLLEEAGVATPVPVELTVTNDTEAVRLGEIVQSLAAEAGFDVSVAPTEFASSLDEATAGNFELYQVGWSGRIDPDGNTHAFHHTTGTLNYSGSSDAAIDELLERGRAVTDDAERREIYAQLVDAVRERRNIIYLYHENLFTGAKQEVSGFEVYGDGLPRLKNVSVGG